MALHFDIRVNGRSIGYVIIRRLEELTEGVPSLYQVLVEYPVGVERETRVRHLYDRGALSLIATALGAVEGGDAYIVPNIDR